MWLQGLYIYNAFQAVIGTAFGKSKVQYEQKPLDVYPKTKFEQAQEKAEKKQKLINFLNSLVSPNQQETGADRHGNS